MPANSTIDATVVRCGAGRIGSSANDRGVVSHLDVGIGGRETAAIEYDVIWLASHQWVKGGKLPGLYGGASTAFGPESVPNGANGFTVRPMWRQNGGAILYVWDMKAGPYGRGPNIPAGIFKAGRRQRVRISVTLNTPGMDDGVATLWVDGVRILSISDLKARTTPAMKLTGCFFCVFYGGGDLSYAPTVDQFITVTRIAAS